MIGVSGMHIEQGGGATNGLLTGLESYYKLDESSGALVDSHNSYNTTTENALIYGSTGIINDAIEFNGSTSYYYYPSGLRDLLTGNFTISFWGYLDALPGSDAFFVNDWSGAGRNFYIRVLSTGVLQATSGDGGVNQDGNVDSVTTLSTTTWYHIAVVRDGTNVKMYIDGSYENDATGTYTGGSTSNSLASGKFSPISAGYLDGKMDEIGFWSRELDSTDITNLYNSGSGLAYGDFTS